MKRLLFSILLMIIFVVARSQEKAYGIRLYLLNDISHQNYVEYSDTDILKSTFKKFDYTIGLGSQITVDLSSFLSFQFGLGIKHTSLDFWFRELSDEPDLITSVSSRIDISNFIYESSSLFHMFSPLSIYFKSFKEHKFKIKPGASIEPNLLIFQNSLLLTGKPELIASIEDPNGSPRRVFGIFSANLEFSYELKHNKGIFVECKLHNTPKYYSEDYYSSSTDLNLGYMINVGLKF